MNISDKRYPYPVLKPDGDDYDGSSFDVAVDARATADIVTIVFTPQLKDNGLKQLIGVEHQAKIVCHLECPKTVFRQVVELNLPICEVATEKEATMIEIPASKLSGEVSVCPFIVATADIAAYTNPSFNSDYECASFTIETGAVMAEGVQKRFVVDTSREALISRNSIVMVTIGDQDLKTVRLDYSGDKIRIEMPKRMYEKYGTLKDNQEDRDVIWAMVFVPAITEVLAMLGATRKYAREDLDEFKTLRWYAALDQAVRIQCGGKGIDTDEFETRASYLELASLIVKNAIQQAFISMSKEWSERM